MTEQATAVIEASPDDDNNLSAALLRLVQQHLFEMLVDLKTEGLTQRDIAKLADSVAQMTRATVMQQKWASELKAKIVERVGAAEREVVAEVQHAASVGGGLSAEAEARIPANPAGDNRMSRIEPGEQAHGKMQYRRGREGRDRK